MRASCSLKSWFAGLLVVTPFGAARGDEPTKTTKPDPTTTAPADEPGVNLLEAARSGSVSLEAEGTGDGRMMIRVTNRTGRKLKVVLPPGLVASGATGQFGGMGGGGMGGGGMGGGMGGGGGGMGGMGGGGLGGGGMGGGGMGGGGGGMGGRGGGGGGGQQLTMPATMGMLMRGRLIMTLVEPTESWNPASLMSGMGGMGGGGMGGMMGGGGGGFRSVPPTDLPNATLAPGQTRGLSTRVVGLNPPGPDGSVAAPQRGERLEIGDVSQLGASPRVQAALRRLARDKAPETVAQLALWGAAGMDWSEVARASRGWANGHELALARQLAGDLDGPGGSGDTGRLLVEVTAGDAGQKALAAEVTALLKGRSMLGLAVEGSVPTRPSGPSVACRVVLSGPSGKPEASVQVTTTDATGTSWSKAGGGRFTLAVPLDGSGKVKADAFGDALAEGLVARLVGVKVSRAPAVSVGPIPAGPKASGDYVIRVENYSPLMLNGVAVSGVGAKAGEPAKMLVGIALSPRRALTLPASREAVERYGLKEGVKVLALDLSGL